MPIFKNLMLLGIWRCSKEGRASHSSIIFDLLTFIFLNETHAKFERTLLRIAAHIVIVC